MKVENKTILIVRYGVDESCLANIDKT